MVFNIRKNATLPILRMELYQDGRNDYNRFQQFLTTSAITFSMRDTKTGIYKVANKPGLLYLKEPCSSGGNKEYYIGYQFTSDDTDTDGIYEAQFKLHVLDINNQLIGEMITPFREELYVHITDSFIKSIAYYS
jgi:hypothetical protein